MTPVQAVGQPRGGERGSQVVTALGEVGPTVVVDGHHAAGAEKLGGFGGLGAVEDDALTVEEDGEAGCAREEDGGVHGAEPFGDLLDQVERGVVATDVDGGQADTGQDEADDLADERFDLLAYPGPMNGLARRSQ